MATTVITNPNDRPVETEISSGGADRKFAIGSRDELTLDVTKVTSDMTAKIASGELIELQGDLSSGEFLAAKVEGIDLAATGTTTLFTVATGTEFVVTRISVLGKTGSPATDADVSVGVTAADIAAVQTLTDMDTPNEGFTLVLVTPLLVHQAAEVIALVVDVAAGAAQTADVFLFGFLA